MLYDIEHDTKMPKEFLQGTFRKLYPPNSVYLERERQLIERLKANPHPNIVSYYQVTDRYVDMECLDTLDFEEPMEEILRDMEKVKTFLQSIGIFYLDWKLDNLVKGPHGYTLIDFDHSGMIDFDSSGLHDSETWVVEPIGWSYREAKQVCATPKEMDDWSFDYNLVKPSYQKLIRKMDYTYPEYLPSTTASNTDEPETQIACETGGLIFE